MGGNFESNEQRLGAGSCEKDELEIITAAVRTPATISSPLLGRPDADKIVVMESSTENATRAKVLSSVAIGVPSDPIQRWSELLFELSRLKLKKRRAIEIEDFAEAGRCKRREVDV